MAPRQRVVNFDGLQPITTQVHQIASGLFKMTDKETETYVSMGNATSLKMTRYVNICFTS